MNKHDRGALCAAAEENLARTPGHRKVTLIWAAVAAGAGILGSLLSVLLDSQIAGTGGLSGMELRSVLSTAQMALSLFTMIALPFWQIGHNAVALEISRTQRANMTTLPEGFRRFGPVLRFYLLQAVVYFALAVLSLNVGSLLLSMTPLAKSLTQQMMPIMEEMYASPDYQPDPAVMDGLVKAMIPMMIGCAALFVALCVPVFYRLRLAQLRLMDEPRCGALYAVLSSVRMMRGQCVSLFLLDLRFWWFYLAEIVISAVCYGDILLPALGVELPFSREIGFFLFYIVAMGAQVALYWFAKNRLAVTYAKFYEQLLPSVEAQNGQ